MFFIVSVLHLVIPDVPKKIQEQIDRENLLTQRALWEVKPEVLNNLRAQSSSDMRGDEHKESDLSRTNLQPNFSRNLNTITKKATSSPLSRNIREDDLNDYEYNDDYDNYDEELNDDQLNEDMILSKQESKV